MRLPRRTEEKTVRFGGSQDKTRPDEDSRDSSGSAGPPRLQATHWLRVRQASPAQVQPTYRRQGLRSLILFLPAPSSRKDSLSQSPCSVIPELPHRGTHPTERLYRIWLPNSTPGLAV